MDLGGIKVSALHASQVMELSARRSVRLLGTCHGCRGWGCSTKRDHGEAVPADGKAPLSLADVHGTALAHDRQLNGSTVGSENTVAKRLVWNTADPVEVDRLLIGSHRLVRVLTPEERYRATRSEQIRHSGVVLGANQ